MNLKLDPSLVKEMGEIANKIQEGIGKIAPPVWKTAALVVQMNAIGTLVVDLVAILVLSLICFFCINKLSVVGEKADFNQRYWNGWSTVYVIRIILGTLAGCSAIICFLYLLCQPWTWISAINGNIGLAHLLLQKALNI